MPVRPRVRPARRQAETPLIFHYMYRVCPKEVDNGSPIEARATIVTSWCGAPRRSRHWFQNSNYPRPRAALTGKYEMSRVPHRDHDHDHDHDPHDRWYLAGWGDRGSDRKCGNANGGANHLPGSLSFKLPLCRCSVKLASLCFINSCRA